MIRQSEPISRMICDNCKKEGPGASSDLAALSAGRAEGWFSVIFGPGPSAVDYCSVGCVDASGIFALAFGPDPEKCPYCRGELVDTVTHYACYWCCLSVSQSAVKRLKNKLEVAGYANI